MLASVRRKKFVAGQDHIAQFHHGLRGLDVLTPPEQPPVAALGKKHRIVIIKDDGAGKSLHDPPARPAPEREELAMDPQDVGAL